jgi:ornithine carbamoyltransferase
MTHHPASAPSDLDPTLRALRGGDLRTLRDLSGPAMLSLLELAAHLKAGPEPFSTMLRGKTLAMIFEKPSLRTRVTFDVAMYQLGGHAIYLSPAEISMGKRESTRDVAKNLERMVQGIMIRTFAQSIVDELAAAAAVPVINALSDFSHPCQGLADYLTMLELKGEVKGLKVAYVGDGNNVAHSLAHGAALVGAHLVIATPAGYEPHRGVIEWARQHGAASGATITLTRDPGEAVSNADVVYTDTWTSMGQEDEAEKRRRIFAPFQVNESLFARAKSDAVFLHCLPAHRGEEVTDAIIDSPQSAVFAQAENRLHAQKAVLLSLMA